jgi:hypothetical protein
VGLEGLGLWNVIRGRLGVGRSDKRGVNAKEGKGERRGPTVSASAVGRADVRGRSVKAAARRVRNCIVSERNELQGLETYRMYVESGVII